MFLLFSFAVCIFLSFIPRTYFALSISLLPGRISDAGSQVSPFPRPSLHNDKRLPRFYRERDSAISALVDSGQVAFIADAGPTILR